MAIESKCASCGRTLRVDDQFAGQNARCPACGCVYVVPVQNVAPITTQSPMQAQGSNSWGKYDPLQETQVYDSSTASNSTSGLPTLQPFSSHLDPSDSKRTTTFGASMDSTGNQVTTNPGDVEFLVRVPDGQIYGPANAQTIRDWASQGRVNATCYVRPTDVEAWIGFSAWQTQQSMSIFGDPRKPNTPNIYGDNFGGAHVPSNQTPTMQSGQGVIILCLGLASWFLCTTILLSPPCAIITIIMANNELRKIQEGRTLGNDKTLVLIGMWAAIANLVFTGGLFVLFLVLAAINP